MDKNFGNLDKRYIVLIIVVIIIIVGGILSYNSIYLQNHAKLGNAYFELPDGYHEVNTPEIINLTNGNNSIFILKHQSNNINESIDDYVKMKGDKYNISVTDFMVNDVQVFKADIPNETTVHYWFKSNNGVYEIFTWTSNSNMDDISKELISNVKFFIF